MAAPSEDDACEDGRLPLTCHVRLHSLCRCQELNGTEGVLTKWDAERRRWQVRLIGQGSMAERMVWVRECNTTRAPSMSECLNEGVEDILALIFDGLPPELVLTSSGVCKVWQTVGLADASWRRRCECLWEGKLHVDIWRDDTTLPRYLAYFLSLRDSRRTCLSAQELCSFAWSARVKFVSGMAHTCPWWRGQRAGHRSYELRTSGAAVRVGQRSGSYVSSERGIGSWEITSGLQEAPTIIQTGRSGAVYPPHRASRWPKNWGWLLQNEFGFSASFPLPPRGEEPELEDGGKYCDSRWP